MASVSSNNLACGILNPVHLGTKTWGSVTGQNDGDRAFFPNVVPRGADMRYDSASGLWLPVSGGSLGIGGLSAPVGIAPSGSFANNGAVTLGTALPNTYNTPGIWLYFPANAIFTGSTAGIYWCVMSSATVGTVYNNTYSGLGLNTPPTSPTAFASTGPGAYTQTTVEVTLFSLNTVGGLLGPNGDITCSLRMQSSGNAISKATRVRFGGQVMASLGVTSLTIWIPSIVIHNCGSASNQIGSDMIVGANTTITERNGTVNTAVDQVLAFSGQLQTGTTDSFIFDVLSVQVQPR